MPTDLTCTIDEGEQYCEERELEKEIDELYGLTEGEIKVVEGE